MMLPTGELASIDLGIVIKNGELYFSEATTGEIFVLPLETVLDDTEELPYLRPFRLGERGWSRNIPARQPGLTPAGDTKITFTMAGDPPCLIISGSDNELEVHAKSMGSRAKIGVTISSIISIRQIELSDNTWCVVLLSSSGRTILIRGKENQEAETFKVDKTVFDTGLGAWDFDEPVAEGQIITFDAICLEPTQRRLIISCKKVATH